MWTKEQIFEQLAAFETALGKPVIVHTSLKAVGYIQGGADTLLSALIEYFTQKGGCLCVPTHTWDSLIYDRRNPHTCLGKLPEAACRSDLGYRTLHPTHSISIFGERKKAVEYSSFDEVSDTPAHPDGCLGSLYKNGGYVLLIGVGHNKNTFIHCIEEMLNVPGRLTTEKTERSIILEDGRSIKRYLYWYDNSKIDDVSVNFNKFEEPFRYHGCITDGIIGNAKVQLCDMNKMKETVELIYNNNSFGELLDNNIPIDKKLYINDF